MSHSPQLCPHDELRISILHGDGPLIGCSTSLSTYHAVRSRCAICDSILGVIEEVMPGWVGERYETRWIKTSFENELPLGVTLYEESSSSGSDVTVYEESSSSGSFVLGGALRGRGALKFILHFQLLRRPICKSLFTSIIGIDSLPIYNNKPQFTKPILAEPFFPAAHEADWKTSGNGVSLLANCYSLDIIEDTRSDLALERISKWLSHCIENHQSCKPRDPNYVPRRLIDVGSFGKKEPSLVEPSQPVPYLCLSYCWGPDTKDVLVTTTANLASHYKAIPLATVPATIRDAISICRGLGFSYLWVDSLCIVQGDQKEWLEDSAQMREIYSNSRLTLSAMEPASCKLGFLGKQSFGRQGWQRLVETDVPVEVIKGHLDEYRLENDGHYEFGGTRYKLFARFGHVPDWTCSLDKRGWCLQESILPQRRLCFSGSEMLWQCEQEKYCECGHVCWTRNVKSKFRGAAPNMSQPFDQYVRPKNYEHWRVLVEEYSDRYLTQKVDKLSAMSGLAKEFGEEHGKLKAEGTFAFYRGFPGRSLGPQCPKIASGDYLAGMWQEEFVYDLAWIAMSSEDRIQIPEIKQSPQYIAPSWSVSYSSDYFVLRVAVLEFFSSARKVPRA